MRLPRYVIVPSPQRVLVVRVMGGSHVHWTHHPIIAGDDGHWEVCDFPETPDDDRLAEDFSDLMRHERVCRMSASAVPAEGQCPWCRLHFFRENVYFHNVIDRSDGECKVIKIDHTTELNLLAAAASIASPVHTGGPPQPNVHGVMSLGHTGVLPTYDYEFTAVPSLEWRLTASPYDVSVQPKPGSLAPLNDSDWMAVRLLNSDATTPEEQRRLRDLTTIVEFVPLSYESQREYFGDVLWPDPSHDDEQDGAAEPEEATNAHLVLPPMPEWEE